jgi:N-acetylglucosamine repressor
MKNLPSKATHQQTKTYNQQLVLRTIYDNGRISRADVARRTKLTRVTVSEIVGELLESGLVAEVGPGQSAGGKTPILLSVVADAYHLIGLDLANDEFRGAVVNLRGEICHSLNLPLENLDGELSLRLVYRLLDELVAKTDRPLLGIGIGTPGLLDTTQGIVHHAVNLGWKDMPLGSLLHERYHLPVYVANDSQVTALAEHIFGAARSETNLVAVRVGRGIGAGIVLNGQLLQGEGFGAGEIGHIAILREGETCRCGNTGCIETVGSSQAITHRARILAEQHPASPLARLVENPAALTLEDVLQADENGDAHVRQIVLEAGRAVGFGIACLISTLNVRHIYLVGSVTRFGEPWLQAVREELQRCSLPALARQTEIAFGELGANAVILGASALLLTHEIGLSLAR